MKNPPVYIVCHRKDYFLAQIAVSSVRYFYPDIEINLIKDGVNGNFDTGELERCFKVNIVNLGKYKYGWTSAKMFLLLSNELRDKKLFLLDADVVFVGRVLDRLTNWNRYDFIVSPEYIDTPKSENFNKYYYDYRYFKTIYSTLFFPGYTFNTGNILISPGIITHQEIRKYFNPKQYPYWTDLSEKTLPTRDQSLLNLLIPLKAKAHQIKLKRVSYMWWFAQDEVSNLRLKDIATGKYKYLIHWAGGKRIPYIHKMRRGDILMFFQRNYYSQLRYGFIRFHLKLSVEFIKYYLYYSPRRILKIDIDPTWMAN